MLISKIHIDQSVTITGPDGRKIYLEFKSKGRQHIGITVRARNDVRIAR